MEQQVSLMEAQLGGIFLASKLGDVVCHAAPLVVRLLWSASVVMMGFSTACI